VPERPVLVITHVPHEGPGLIAAALDGWPVTVRTVVDVAAPRLPDVSAIAGLVVMGGPQDADDDAGHPGLAAERDLIAAAVAADVPVLGVCLGMQLLAIALGSRLVRRSGSEIGFAPITVLADDPALAPLGTEQTVLHWHSDSVRLPDGATLLASSETTPVQAFRFGSALGLQFHLEVDANLLDLWLTTPAMANELSDDDIDAIRTDGAAVLPTLIPAGRAALATFAAAVHARG